MHFFGLKNVRKNCNKLQASLKVIMTMCDYDDCDENFVCFHVGGGDGLLNLYLHLDGDRAIAREYGDNDVNGGCEYNGGIGDGDSAYCPPAKGLPHLCL